VVRVRRIEAEMKALADRFTDLLPVADNGRA